MKLNPGFIEYIRTNMITSIDLAATAQDDENIRNFAAALKDHRYITDLEFAESKINDNQLRILSEAISQNQFLCSIDLSINPITEQGIKYLAAAIEKSTSIQVVNLSYIELTPRSIELLNKAILKSPSMRRIIPDEIMTPEIRHIIFYRDTCKTILELIAQPSEESAAVLLRKVCEIAQKHYSSPTQEPSAGSTKGPDF